MGGNTSTPCHRHLDYASLLLWLARHLACTFERDGFVKIKPSPTDGRIRLIELTKDGRRLHERAAPLWRAAQREFEELNGVENATALREGLKAMVVGDVKEHAAGD